jgi:hypothetical protein
MGKIKGSESWENAFFPEGEEFMTYSQYSGA